MSEIAHTIPKANKHHKCGCCCGAINVGEKYVRSFEVFEGHPATFKSHIKCRDLFSYFVSEWYEDGMAESDYLYEVDRVFAEHSNDSSADLSLKIDYLHKTYCGV